MAKLAKEELINIVYGSAFFGGGGGGSLVEGCTMVKEIDELGLSIDLIPVSDMEDDETIVSTMVAALGSPIATKGKTFIDEAVNSIKGMGVEAKDNGKTLKYVYSGEMGGGNTLLPLYAAAKLGMQVLDTDGNGRAVPELNTGLAPIHDIPTSPVVLASSTGDTIIGRTADPLDSKGCETIARQMSMAYDMGIGFAAWMMSKKDHEKASAIGQITLANQVGNLLRTVKASELHDGLVKILGEGNVFTFVESGTITKIDINTAGGFDDGTFTVTGDDGAEYTLRFQNENLIAFDASGKAVATVPDIISIVQIDGDVLTPLSNSETEEGQKVALIVVRANERWNDAGGYECWADTLIDAGYSVAGPKVEL